MKNIVVDFETYYDKELSVTEVGLSNYVQAADAYLMALCGDGGIKAVGPPRSLAERAGKLALDPELQFWAFNANFDQTFWNKYFPRTVHPWKCVSDLAAFNQYPRDLARVAKVVLGKVIDKTIRDRMKGVHYESLAPDEQKAVADYCLTDAVEEREILRKLPAMTPVEEAIANHTRMINRRGVQIDTARVERDTEALHRIKFDAYHALPWTSFCETPLSYARFAEWCQEMGSVAPPSLDKRNLICQEWAKQHPKLFPVLRHMRTFRGANTKLEKLRGLQAKVNPQGVLPLEMLYCGARHTRRWSCVGFNVQNLDKEPVFAEIMAHWPEFADANHPHFDVNIDPGIFLRHYLKPPPGCVFGIIDYAQIEPRCLNWLAGNDELLEAIRRGYSYYEAYAGVHKNWRGQPGKLKSEYGLERYTKLKNEALGLGYGMGVNRYIDYARVPPLEAEQIVKEFRRLNPKITALWRSFDALIRDLTQMRERTLELEMPTGDLLRQFHVRCKLEGGGYESFSTRGDYSQASRQPNLWGGTLAENVTQRMARDVLAEAVLRLEQAGFPVIFHAHDELILALPEGTAQKDFAEALRLMSQPPDWCPDLPLAAEGGIFPHYTKM